MLTKEPEQADKEDEKSENKNEADIQNGLEIDSELRYRVFLIPIMVQIRTTIMMEVIIINL